MSDTQKKLKKFTRQRGVTMERPKHPYTYEEVVMDSIFEWYMSRGMNVPPEDLEACRGIDREIQEQHLADMERVVETKPVYGTAEFWKQWWQKKKAKEQAVALPAKAPFKFKSTKGGIESQYRADKPIESQDRADKPIESQDRADKPIESQSVANTLEPDTNTIIKPAKFTFKSKVAMAE